jgi:hypothetical protein
LRPRVISKGKPLPAAGKEMLINPFQQEGSAMVQRSLKAFLAVVLILGFASVAYAGTLDDIAQR